MGVLARDGLPSQWILVGRWVGGHNLLQSRLKAWGVNVCVCARDGDVNKNKRVLGSSHIINNCRDPHSKTERSPP